MNLFQSKIQISISFLSAILSCFFSIQCAVAPVSGLVYTEVSFPGLVQREQNVPETKVAEGCIQNYLAVFSKGDAGAGSIAYKAGIQRISSIDHSSRNYFTLVYQEYCTVVRGE